MTAPAPPPAAPAMPGPPAAFRPGVVIAAIIVNAVCIFLDGFPFVRESTGRLFLWLDLLFILYFLAEAIEKFARLGVRGYFSSGWNRFDLLVLLVSLPALASPFLDTRSLSSLMSLRLGRIVRFTRLLRFVPDGERILAGVARALRASVAIFLAVALTILVLGIISAQLFDDLSPAHFGDPLRACYTIFKVFTVEGWYTVPDEIACEMQMPSVRVAVHAFFVFAVMLGILSLSLANAVFVDEMTADNTDTLERLVGELTGEVSALRDEVAALRREVTVPRDAPSVAGPPADNVN